jgi:sugar phosphate isomerase/epimerase
MRTLTFGFLNLNFPPASNAPPLDVVKAAGDAGFKSVGVRLTGRRVEDTPWEPVIGNKSRINDIRREAADRGMHISSTTSYGFFPDLPMDAHKRTLDATAELGSDLVVLNVYYEDHDALAKDLAEFCKAAEKYNIRAGVEFMPFSGLRTMQQTTRVLQKAGSDNAGIILDALHLVRSGGSVADIRTLDPKKIFLGQLCDAKDIKSKRTDDELRAEARAAREYPGEGDVPLHDFIRALPENMEIEIEVPRSDHNGLSLADRARKIGGIFRDYMDGYEKAMSGR